MTAIQRFALHGTIMNPHSSGPYVRHEDHLAAMQGRCLAQIEEPAQPVCWIRFCSDGSTEGPIMHSQICEARKTSGAWTPLYAGAAPAAVAPEHPPMPDTWAVVASIEGQDVVCISSSALSGKGELTESEEQAVIGMAQHLLAFVGYGLPPCDFDPDDEPAAAPALEAPAAHAGWKLVPVEPTREMLDAYLEMKGLFHSARSDWAAMLAAAPQAPAAPSAVATQVIENLLQLARIVNTAVEDWGESFEDGSMEVTFHKEEADAMEAILEFFDSLPDAPPEEGVIESGPLRAARVLRALAAPAAPAVDAETVEDAERFRAMAKAVLGESGERGRYPELGEDATLQDVRATFDAAIAAQAAAKGAAND